MEEGDIFPIRADRKLALPFITRDARAPLSSVKMTSIAEDEDEEEEEEEEEEEVEEEDISLNLSLPILFGDTTARTTATRSTSQ